MIYALPDTPYTAVLNAGIEGLVGTLKVQLERADGTTAVGATTAGIVEIEPKVYAKADNLAPSTKGTYIVVWTGPEGQRAAEELIVTTNLPEEGSGQGWEPTVSEVAALIRARTKIPGGGEAGTFTEQTRPTKDEVERIIHQAADHVSAAIGGEPCNDQLTQSATAVTALLAAVIIETSYWPEQAEARGSAAARLEKLFDTRMKSLTSAVAEQCGGQGEGDSGDGNAGAVAAGSFSDGYPLIGRDYPERW